MPKRTYICVDCRITRRAEAVYGLNIHSTKVPEHKDVAEKCMKELSKSYLLRHHWYVAIPLIPIAWLSRKLEKRQKYLAQ
jgi:hypothetical protein